MPTKMHYIILFMMYSSDPVVLNREEQLSSGSGECTAPQRCRHFRFDLCCSDDQIGILLSIASSITIIHGTE